MAIHIKLCSLSGPAVWDGTEVPVSRVPCIGEGLEIGGNTYVTMEVTHTLPNADGISAKVFIRAK